MNTNFGNRTAEQLYLEDVRLPVAAAVELLARLEHHPQDIGRPLPDHGESRRSRAKFRQFIKANAVPNTQKPVEFGQLRIDGRQTISTQVLFQWLSGTKHAPLVPSSLPVRSGRAEVQPPAMTMSAGSVLEAENRYTAAREILRLRAELRSARSRAAFMRRLVVSILPWAKKGKQAHMNQSKGGIESGKSREKR